MVGIFYNSTKSNCSIYESGLMCYQALSRSNKYKLIYTEKQCIDEIFDFSIVNWHHAVNNWINQVNIKSLSKINFSIVTEVSHDQSNPMPLTIKCFDNYILLDPTYKDNGNIYGFSRPLEVFNDVKKYEENKYPIIGSFGMPTPGKNFESIINQVQKEFDEALIRINIPYATYVPQQQFFVNQIIQNCNQLIYKDKIKIIFSKDYMSKQDLINWCASNTINIFLYQRNQTGLSATTDQAISSGRPLLVSECDTFRHIHKYIKPFPQLTIKQAIETSGSAVSKMLKDWHPDNFMKKFESILFGDKT